MSVLKRGLAAAAIAVGLGMGATGAAAADVDGIGALAERHVQGLHVSAL